MNSVEILSLYSLHADVDQTYYTSYLRYSKQQFIKPVSLLPQYSSQHCAHNGNQSQEEQHYRWHSYRMHHYNTKLRQAKKLQHFFILIRWFRSALVPKIIIRLAQGAVTTGGVAQIWMPWHVMATDKVKCQQFLWVCGNGRTVSQTDTGFLQREVNTRWLHMATVVERVALKYILLWCTWVFPF